MNSLITTSNKRKAESSLLGPMKHPCRPISPSRDLSYEEFELLDNRTRKKYFDSMRKWTNDWESFKKAGPRIDIMVLQHHDRDNRLTSEEQSNANSVDMMLKEIWRLKGLPVNVDSEHRSSRANERKTRWYDDDLRWNQDECHFELECSQRPYRHAVDMDGALSQYGLCKHISSSLLWYRLNIFTKSPITTDTDNYKQAWDMQFHHLDGASTLRVWNSKGAPRAVFDGLEKSQIDAQKFLNFLTMFKFPHTYDGVIAGTVA
ncbi:uncharacterized protein N7483_011261 [Penicillium malachiteum]|uniref:uncharacterized protein n=1 Tax=Penicillium malachiteum TaxID=1324776 RepID=UPI0025476F80|nr:uncharacterized protein N7483_011261 [Penicillium malachiteum]KAJ5714080.1 hypothetical protein N7483_011261 [Penicillium malachiteum]